MPVQLRSISGKVDYDVEQVIRDLVIAVNRLEAVSTPDLAPVLADLVSVTERVSDLEQRVQVLTQDVADLQAAP